MPERLCQFYKIHYNFTTKKIGKVSPVKLWRGRYFTKCRGQANWLASQTRLDISFDVLNLSWDINKNLVVNHLIEANKMIGKVKNKESKLVFPNLGTVDDLKFVAFADASYENLPDGASSAGGCYIISWTKQQCKYPIMVVKQN